MVIEIADAEFHVVKATERSARSMTGRRGAGGWFWQDVTVAPVGPFPTLIEAFDDLARHVHGRWGKEPKAR